MKRSAPVFDPGGSSGAVETAGRNPASDVTGTGDHHMGAAFAQDQDNLYFFCSGENSLAFLIYADKTSGISGPLCGKAECLHEDETCNAWCGTFLYGAILLKEDRLVIASSALDESDGGMNDVCIYSLKRDGSGRKLLRNIGDPWEGGGRVNPQMMFCHDMLFVSGLSQTVKEGYFRNVPFVHAYGISDAKEDLVICEREETSGFPQIIMQSVAEGAFFLIQGETGETDTSGVHSDLVEWHREDASVEVLWDGIFPEYMAEMMPESGKILFTSFTGDRLYCLDKGKSEVVLVYELETDYSDECFQFCGNKTVCYSFENGQDHAKRRLRIVGPDGKTQLDCTFEEPFPSKDGKLYMYNYLGNDGESLYYYLIGYGTTENEYRLISFSVEDGACTVFYEKRVELR